MDSYRKSNFTEKELIRGIIQENNDVLLFIYRKCYRPVRHLVIVNSGSEEDAQDIFQESLIILYKKLKYNNLKLRCSINTFLFSIARLLWLKELKLRDGKFDDSRDCDTYKDEESDIIEIYEQNERLSFYRKIFEQLSNDCKKVLMMFMKSYSVSEITKIMGYNSEQHTKNRRYRCKKSLINKILQNPKYYELKNEVYDIDREIPRWYAKK